MKKIITKGLIITAFVFGFMFVNQKANAQYYPPDVINSATTATNITPTSAKLNGRVNPKGFTTYAWFEVWQFGNQQFGFQNIGNSVYNTNMNPLILANLNPNTTYNFRVVAQNPWGYDVSPWISFTTTNQSSVPTVVSLNASNITQQTATLNGVVNPNGTFTWAWFERLNGNGTITKIPVSNIHIGSENQNVSMQPYNLTGLYQGTTYTFRLVAENQHGKTYGNWINFTTQSPVLPQPTVSLSANPTSVAYNGSTTLNWVASNATLCVASGGWSGNKNVVSGSQTISNLISNTTFTLTCSNGSNSVQSSVNVSVAQPNPTVTISANPTSIISGGSTTLSWNTTNVTSCVASGGWSGYKNANGGSQVISNLTQSTTFVITCSNNTNSVTNSVIVTVQQAPTPTVTLTANPTNVAYNGSTNLSWTSTNATSCVASGGATGWAGNKLPNGSQPMYNLTQSATFTLTCSNGNNNSAPSSVTVTVQSQTQAPTLIFVANPLSVPHNGITTLYWSTANATSCIGTNGSLGWVGSKPTSGSWISGPLTQNTMFLMSCQGPGGTTIKTINITVASPVQ